MKLIIPDNVIKIQAYEFRDKTELTEVVIPDSVETIGEGAFKGCRNLNRITVGSRVNQVGLFAFDGIGSHIEKPGNRGGCSCAYRDRNRKMNMAIGSHWKKTVRSVWRTLFL